MGISSTIPDTEELEREEASGKGAFGVGQNKRRRVLNLSLRARPPAGLPQSLSDSPAVQHGHLLRILDCRIGG